MNRQENTATELFSPEVGPFWRWPGLMRCIVGCVVVGAGLLAMVFGVQQVLAADVSPLWCIALGGAAFVGIHLFACCCYFPDDNRTINEVASNT